MHAHIYTDSDVERRGHPTAPEIWPFFSISLSINPLPPSSICSSFSFYLRLSFTLGVLFSQSLKFSLIQFYLPFTVPRRQAESRPIKTALMEDWWTGTQDSTAFRPNYFLPIFVTLILRIYRPHRLLGVDLFLFFFFFTSKPSPFFSYLDLPLFSRSP